MNTLIARSMKAATKRFYNAWHTEIQAMIEKGYRDGIRHNPRLIMYKLMSHTRDGITIGKSKAFSEKISGVVNVLRYRGFIENHWTMDTTRNITHYEMYDSKTSALAELSRTFRLDRWKSQPRKLLLMCEASGYLGVIEHIAGEFLCPYVPAKGDMSVQIKMQVAMMCSEPTTILYYGDYDAKGREIPATIEADIRAMNPGCDLEFKRMFINADDIRKYSLDVDAGGNVQMEQLDTDIAIRESVAYIRSIIDTSLWNRVLEEEKAIRESLQK